MATIKVNGLPCDECKGVQRHLMDCPTIKKVTAPTPPETPECNKLKSVAGDKAVITDFIEWMEEKRAAGVDVIDEWPTRKIIAEYFEIDEEKLEDERRALLEYQRQLNAQ